MKPTQLFSTRNLYIAFLSGLMGYYMYCDYTGQRFFQFNQSSQWSPSGNSGFHHK